MPAERGPYATIFRWCVKKWEKGKPYMFCKEWPLSTIGYILFLCTESEGMVKKKGVQK